MPKLKETPVQRMERVFRAAVFYGLERRAETIDNWDIWDRRRKK